MEEMKKLTECGSFEELFAECASRHGDAWREDGRDALSEAEEREFVAACCAPYSREFAQRDRIPTEGTDDYAPKSSCKDNMK